MSNRFCIPFFIVGPTASGKSALALALAEKVGGEIVNADAFQLYRGMDILTAKPAAADFEKVPHHLYGVIPLKEACDAQRYREMALPVIADIAARGKLPVVVGGSGLYVKSLSHGLASLPPTDPDVRSRVAAMAAEDARDLLLTLDPQAGDNVPLANPRYVSRALEICLMTGRPQSELRQTFAQTEPAGCGVVLQWEREDLYARINQRVEAMLEAGLLKEVTDLPELGLTAKKAIGLREMRAHLAGELPMVDAIESMQQTTRRYAKRQMTWFRRETWLQTICLDSQSTAESALTQLIDRFPWLLSPLSNPSPST
ncbi:tRNA dimethylallyltransferase [Prosthecobacter fusiformis]|uniref:tRNA dimethylallyltransferase n=1 Tax=Prosthecobacter fusiformis TaxID=48464 RepID=A0A4R7S3Q5_9BACT|nr:tRNA (adenosine(37)-N6)-dimethylallyltransferase MiaA [Prosthecobacter fusiformis]TDU72914.1 tRNA dimethylallyltransferase [Prosthecobacter fusiformis]